MQVRLTTLLMCLTIPAPFTANADEPDSLRRTFHEIVRPFLTTYCTGCHAGAKPKAKFDLSPYRSLEDVAGDLGHWQVVLDRLRAGEMPPDDADRIPREAERQQVIAWIEQLRRHEASRNAGDPGFVPPRRLSNAEYDYSIHDLTGIDIRPTREFPIDPANEAGFDNSGESLAMSPALLSKYLEAARHVADHLVFLPTGLAFAPHPMVVYSDRDKFAVHRIVDFYKRQPVDYADYFAAAWRYRHRAELGMPDATLEELARQSGTSAKYLNTVWAFLDGTEDHAGPISVLREQWRLLPAPSRAADREPAALRAACQQLRDWVAAERSKLNVPEGNFVTKPLNNSTQPIILWKNRSIAANRRLGQLPESDGSVEAERLREAVARFCNVFPDTFYISERGRMFLPPKERDKGRLLNAGFHLMVGYFRDDAPLYDLVLEPPQQQELDAMWVELDFITLAPIRQFSDYVYFERAEQPGFLKSEEFAFAREDADVTSEPKMKRLAALYLEKARGAGIEQPVLDVIDGYFHDMSDRIRRLERQLADAEPVQLEALLALAERAWRRPLAHADRTELVGYYRSLREQERLSHEDALRDTLASVLVSPRFCYRTATAEPGTGAQPLSPYELASRLSYFLWSSVPDAELLNLAAAGRLQDEPVLLEQTRRMLHDPRVRRLATEFAGHWLDFRRFESHNAVDRDRFPQFTPELRQAMFEEPVRFFTDLVHRNGSVLDCIYANHTFVNPILAAHYGIPVAHEDPGRWVRVDEADRYGRGGMLPMAVFLTQNSPGLRTSPVKRGYWVVRRLLGEHIPAPPPEVPELPADESKLGALSLRDVLAKHRESKSCAGCHSRFDSVGLVFEGFGPVGERRELDLGGRPVDVAAVFPDGSAGEGLEGLRRYVRDEREAEFIDNLCRKLLAYALGRSLQLSDESTVQGMKDRLSATDFKFGSLVETIVASPQFTHKRGRDYGGVEREE